MSNDFNRSQLVWWQSRLTQGKISRREFMGRTMALGVTTALASSLATQAAQAAGPKQGGVMKLAMGHGSTADTYNPAIIENGYQWVLVHGFANTLTEVAPNGTLVPSLAESWEPSADAATWTFKLRKGVEFHNGKTMTAKDVVASIDYHRNDESKSAGKPLVASVESIKADDDHTVVMSLTGGNADFPFNFDAAFFTIFPAKEEGGIAWEEANGTGAYKLLSYDPGVSAVLERNPNYWKEGRAHADRVELLTIADPAARSNALVTGEVHAIDQVDLKTVSRLAKQPGVVIEEQTGPLHYTLPMRTSMAPFDNIHVRQALKFAIDREELVQKILLGHGAVGNDTPIGPSYRYYAADLEQNSYDPEKAKFHLKQAGLDSLSLPLSAADAAFAGAVDAATLYREHAAKAGIDIQVVREPNDGYWSNVWMKKPWCACYWGGYTTEDAMFSTGYAPGAAWNDTDWDHEAFNKLMIEARAELDEGKRSGMYHEMQRIMRDEGGVVVPMFANAVVGRSEDIAHGEDVSALKPFDGRRIIERWWLV